MTASAGPRKRWPGTGRQTGGGSPAHQEALDHMEEMVAAVIPEENVTGIQGQDSTDYQETKHMHGPWNPPDPPSVTRRSTEQAAIAEDPHTTPIVQPASSNTAEDSDDTATSFERTVVGVQRELAKEVRVGMQTMAASLEGVCLCMVSTEEQAAAMQGRTTILQEVEKRLKEMSTAVIQLTQHLQQQFCQHMHKCNIELLRADLAAYHRDVVAILKNQQILLTAVLPLRPPQVAATGMSDSTSTHTEVCVAPSQTPPPRAEEATHTSEDEDQEQITSHVEVPRSTSLCRMATYYQGPALCNMPVLQKLYSGTVLQPTVYLVSLPSEVLSLCTV
ncbi:hypothetical protein NDU88_007221 [Pleurodeles waltl]|uniref:Uncharacterized protein n=1 Tax=Pleurodeles waltl TaxID=8319 RepID=A0AAV7UNR6_PLEWA|nr:hypothetical protein NDU88_007221 [Pleurodeles waltl]